MPSSKEIERTDRKQRQTGIFEGVFFDNVV